MNHNVTPEEKTGAGAIGPPRSIVNAELEYLVFEPRKEFIIMALLVVGNVPIMYFLNKDWYHTLTHTVVGQVILAVCAAAIFISTAFVIKLTKPIEYKR